MAEKTIYTCDRCGKEIPDYRKAAFLESKPRGFEMTVKRYLHRVVKKGEVMGVSESFNGILCAECFNSFIKWFKNE